MRTLGIACTLLVLGTAGGLAAEASPEVRFERLTMADGLPENDILAVVQDQLGFLWLGTTNGLVKYDGTTFTSYKPDPADPESLGGRIILDLYEDRGGELWIATRRGGLNRLDRGNDRFVRFTHDPADPESLSFDAVAAVFEDRSGVLWVGTGDLESPDAGGGLNRFDRASGGFTGYRHDPADPRSLSHDVVSSVTEDREGRLWVGTGYGGLNRLDDPADPGGGFTHYRHDPQDPASLASDRITAIHQDRRGTLWVATDGGGLQRFDPATGGWVRHRHHPADPASLLSDRVRDLHEDAEGSLWLATCGGVSQYDPDRGTFARYRHDPGDPTSLSDSYCIASIAEDRSGILWFGTLGGGLNKLDRSADKFLHLAHDPRNPDSLIDDRVHTVIEDRAGILWIGTRGGLSSLDPGTGSYTGYRHDPADPGSLADDRVQTLHQDRAGVLWVGTRHGLHRFEPRTRSFTRYRHRPGDPASLSADSVWAIHEDRRGELWIGTGGGGLNRFDRATGSFTRYGDDDDARNLSHAWVMTVYEDRRETLWIGTDGQGLHRFDRDRGRFTSYFSPLEGLDLITALHEDAAGRLWVGTYNGGLHLFDRDRGTSRAFTERDGLAHDTVFALLEDGQGYLWISTGRGLSKFHPGEGRFRNYDARDGLAGRLSGGACKTRRGELFFGGDDGINVFFPELVEDNPHPPQVVLTDLKIFNRSVIPDPGGDSPLSRHISVAEEVRLTHRQNALTFAFAALHYGNPERNRYAFRLDPFDRGWTEAGGRRTATYTNLGPGEYTFRVRAANGDGVWNQEGASLSLVIAPPWWRTWWAWIAYALALAAGVGVSDRARRAHLLKQERAKAAQREAVLRAEAAEHQARAAEHQAKAAEAQAVLLQAENDRQTRELEEARQLQLSMLPRTVPWHPEVEIAAAMRTASEVGGDYYDFDVGDDGTLTFAVGDATGHGTKAGTVVAAAKSLFHLLAVETEVVQILRRATRAFKRMSLKNLYMSLAVGKLRGGVLELASAGIPPALLVRAGRGEVEEVGVPGMPLGGLIRFPYRGERCELAAGDTVVLMSDGLPETLGDDDEQFGYERVAAAFERAAGGSPQEIIERLFAASEEWGNGRPQNDDMTLVVLRVK